MNSDLASLLRAVQDSDWQVRWLAVSALARARGRDGLKGIIDTLKDDDRQVRSKAARVLSQVNDSAVLAPATEALHDSNNYVRERARLTIERMGDAAAESLTQLFSVERHLAVRRKVIALLGRIGGPRTADCIVSCLRDSNWQVREAAALALGGSEAQVQ